MIVANGLQRLIWLKEDIKHKRNEVINTQLYECHELLGILLTNLLDEVCDFLVVWLTYYTGENQEAKNKCRELGLQKLEEYKDRARLCGIYTLHQHENFMLEDLIRLKES